MATRKPANPQLAKAVDDLGSAAQHVRQALQGKIDDLRGAASSELDKVKAAARGKTDKVQGKVETALKRAESRLHNMIAKAQKALDKAVQQARAAGFGGNDFSAMVDALCQAAGIPKPRLG